MSTPDCDCSDYHFCTNCQERESTRRDVQTTIELQKREQYGTEDGLAFTLERRFGWNSHHAEEIAELAWIELYVKNEGE